MGRVARRIGMWMALSAATGSALAQSESSDKVEKIVVTGTRIPRPDGKAASPIVTYDARRFEMSGTLSLEDFLNVQPQFNPNSNRTSNNGDGGVYLELRAAGINRTLTLLNGRRLAPAGVESAVDLNALPTAIIERIDVVTGGESAVYGSDAIAGVVNIVTRRSFEGVAARWQTDIYGAGDGQVNNANIVWGVKSDDDRAHMLVYFDFLERNEVRLEDRNFSRVVFGEDGAGNPVPSRSINTPAGVIDRATSDFVFEPDGSLRPFVDPDDFSNFNEDQYLQIPMIRRSAGFIGRYEFLPTTEIFAEFMYSRPQVATGGVAISFTTNLDVPIDAPFFTDQARQILTDNFDPDGDGIARFRLRRRLSEVGDAQVENIRENYRGLAGVRGQAWGWDWEIAYSATRNDNDREVHNGASQARILQGVFVNPATGLCTDPSGGCVPVNLFGKGALSAEAADFVRVAGAKFTTQVKEQMLNAYTAGEVFDVGDEALAGSFGAEWRRTAAKQRTDALLTAGQVLGFGTVAPVDGAFEVAEVFGEMLLPVNTGEVFGKRLELEAGLRYSDHLAAEPSWTWKYGGQWRVTDDLRVRAMAQRAVRAPSIRELFEEDRLFVRGVLPVDDYCAAANDPVGRGLADICISQGMSPDQIGVFNPTTTYSYDAITSGNPGLLSETGVTLTSGIDWSFGGEDWDARAGLDFLQLKLKSAIARSQLIVDCGASHDPSSAMCQAIERDAEGFITLLRDIPINFAVAEIKALDVNFVLRADVPDWGAILTGSEVTFEGTLTHYLRHLSGLPGQPVINCAGTFRCGGGSFTLHGSTTPVNVAVSTLRYGGDEGAVQIRWRWIDDMVTAQFPLSEAFDFPLPALAVYRIEDISYFDVSAELRLDKSLVLRTGVDNLFETRPPFFAGQQIYANTDPTRYDVFGRRFFFSINVRLQD